MISPKKTSENTLLIWVFSTLDIFNDYPTFTPGREKAAEMHVIFLVFSFH